MAESPEKTLQQLAVQQGRYPEAAYHFVREGLGYAVHRVHGPESPAQVTVMRYLLRHGLDLADLREMYESGGLSTTVVTAIDDAGGFERLNRHVSGQDLSWGLRDYAQQRWGKLARCVLVSWGIVESFDFGQIVFAMIDSDFMQKQPSDSIDDFRNVFDFAEAFDGCYQITFEQ